jgi:hypothetical protein
MAIEEDIPWSTLVLRAIEENIEDVGVSMPASVISYDRATQTARVRPGLTKRVSSYTDYEDTFFEDLPDMYAVPVLWPGGDGSGTGSSFFHPSLEAGEGVLLVCSDADFTRWLKTGKKSNPADARMHHYGKCVAIPGFRPKSDRLAPSPVVLAAGGTTRSMALAEPLLTILQALATQLVAFASPPLSASPTVAPAAIAAIGTALQTALELNFASQYVKSGG